MPENFTNCLLCRKHISFYCNFREHKYYRCAYCRAIMMDPASHLSPEQEKSRYDEHNNDINDPGYQRFVAPLVEAVKQKYSQSAKGLDFGSGPGPVAAYLLEKSGYKLSHYDPYYRPDIRALEEPYDYIILNEVIEHFRNPAAEFAKLRSLLSPGGALFCYTLLIDDALDFASWYYKNDPTHLFFYHCRSLVWIKKHFSFCRLQVTGRLIIFSL